MQLCPLASKFPEFLRVAESIYAIACIVSRLRIQTGGEWCAVPRVLMIGLEHIVLMRALARQTDFRRLCDCVISEYQGDEHAAAEKARLVQDLLVSAGSDLTGAAADWAARVRANAGRMAREVDSCDADRAARAAVIAAEVDDRCAEFERELAEIRARTPGWDSGTIALAQRYGYSSTRVQRRLAILHPSEV